MNMMTRRELGAVAGVTLAPRSVLGGAGHTPPSDRINIACIGVGSQGLRVMLDFMKHPDVRISAVCDVNRRSSDYPQWGKTEFSDSVRELLGGSAPPWVDYLSTNRPVRLTPEFVAAGGFSGWEPCRRIVDAYYGRDARSGSYRGCRAYTDYRELLEKEKDCDAVIVCTPDHWHAHVAVAAMRKGKHVFSQKPMTHSIAAARKMAEVAATTGVATQVAVGNQASEDTRLIQEWIGAGAIGKVREVYNWSTRPVWPQALNRPAGRPPVPAGLDWDFWVGPSPQRPYHPIYLPFVWRGWHDFGAGAIGDMGCYSFDTIFRALDLAPPHTVEASSTYLYKESYPAASAFHMRFAARGARPPVLVHWLDGRLKPARPRELVADGEDFADEGLLFIGDAGKLLCEFNGKNPRLIPRAKMKAFNPPPKSLPRSPGNEHEWLDAIKSGLGAKGHCGANFAFSAKVTEAILLGNVAQRSGGRVEWDSAAMKAANTDAAALISPAYRSGWEL